MSPFSSLELILCSFSVHCLTVFAYTFSLDGHRFIFNVSLLLPLTYPRSYATPFALLHLPLPTSSILCYTFHTYPSITNLLLDPMPHRTFQRCSRLNFLLEE